MADVVGGKVRVLTVTISDLRKRHQDEAGKRVDQELTDAGLTIVRHAVVADEPEFIRALVRTTCTQNEADAMVLVGGTGINPRDQTYEALEALFDKKIPGFGEAFRRLAFESMGPRAMYFRASAGVVSECPVFSLPGNVPAVLLAVRQLLIPTLVPAVLMSMGKETHTSGRPESPSSRDVTTSGRPDTPSSRDVNASVKPPSST
jgi:molybdenum cofactor biosynthesis protein B